MDELNIDKELIDYEPTTASTTSNHGQSLATDHAGSYGASRTNGRSIGSSSASPATGYGTERNGRTHAGGLGKSFADIASANTSGPTTIITGITSSNELARAELERAAKQRSERRWLEQSAHESALESSRGRLIEDIRPGISERVAVVESKVQDNHEDIRDLNRELHREIKQTIQLAVDDNLTINGRIDREILPAITNLQRKDTMKMVISMAVLIISFAANLLQLYYYFEVKHL